MKTSAPHYLRASASQRVIAPRRYRMAAFSLVELLVVMGIMSMLVGLSIVAVRGSRSSTVKHAASQVVSGLSLARQTAIAKNAPAAFIIATNTGNGFPSKPFLYWAIVYSNRADTNWILAKDWEKLPEGALFLETRGPNDGPTYTPRSPMPITDPIGQEFEPSSFDETFDIEAIIINNDTNNTIFNATNLPCVIFSPDGSSGSTGQRKGIRIAQGSVVSSKAVLTSTNSYYFIETDGTIGRVRMRDPESYR